MKTRNIIFAIVFQILFIGVLVHIWYLYSEYGELGLYGSIFLYAISLAIIFYAYVRWYNKEPTGSKSNEKGKDTN